MRRLHLTLFCGLALALTLASCDSNETDTSEATALASAVAKAPLCHYDADADAYHLISVGAPAVAAHRAHGDALPGEPVPTMDGFTFDDACVAQPDFDCAESGGVEVEGACWYLSAAGQSCTAACDEAGLVYDEATRTVAGSDGTDGSCSAVLDALEAPDYPFFQANGIAIGCFATSPGSTGSEFFRARHSNPTTADASSTFYTRACACETP